MQRFAAWSKTTSSSERALCHEVSLPRGKVPDKATVLSHPDLAMGNKEPTHQGTARLFLGAGSKCVKGNFFISNKIPRCSGY